MQLLYHLLDLSIYIIVRIFLEIFWESDMDIKMMEILLRKIYIIVKKIFIILFIILTLENSDKLEY